VTDGLLVVDKPAGWTSHDVVARIRRLAGTRRVGHAGTLDPMATGVLVVGLDRGTRLLGHLALSDKDYDATIRLGVSTTTDDAEGDVVAEHDAGGVTDDALSAATARFVGDIEQVPSAVSAVKVDGERAYKRARRGEDVQLAPRPVHVARFDVVERRGRDVDVRVTCSTGTYVRALARDLGDALGVGAHLTALRRTRVGGFTLRQAHTLDQLADELSVVPLAEAVAASFPQVWVSDDDARRLGYGQQVDLDVPSGVVVGLFAPDGSVVALGERRDGRLRTVVVFAPAESPADRA
jgi:tRNA pseudouridine55 synthase